MKFNWSYFAIIPSLLLIIYAIFSNQIYWVISFVLLLIVSTIWGITVKRLSLFENCGYKEILSLVILAIAFAIVFVISTQVLRPFDF